MDLLVERSRHMAPGSTQPSPTPNRELQNYLIREFLESLYGMESVLRGASKSERAFQQALLGEFSPVRLGRVTLAAFMDGRRTATATAFQLVELLRLVDKLSPEQDGAPPPDWLSAIRGKATVQLLHYVSTAAGTVGFRGCCNAASFRDFVAAVLEARTVTAWKKAVGKS